MVEVTPAKPSDEVLRTLALLSDIEWARVDVGYDSGNRRTPPFVVWRYKSEGEQVSDNVLHAVGSYDGNVVWFVSKPGRNWVLKPMLVATVYQKQFDIVDRKLFNRVGAEYPSFTELAITDFPRLFLHLANEWHRPARTLAI